ncbi:mannosidase alpha-like ER degradation enhancer 2 [Mucilaginibacter frigoritolerans]|uniref:Mannosidase alpha-like ER degradation enhancer 2 n=1 Tax=Mucilaginibacter frigoritolerans TaxID=652788 RepID=A0A562TMP5_9SPHI|nr:glycoside hydrolase family 47 protein [Mucilaginibacter frigoritolerans]TWI94544.1 mannosidase alpha-like ER degradation enhancer 2 [Mucilaginibacter frigoritolerans]
MCLIGLSLKAQDKKIYTAQDVKDEFVRTWLAYKQYAWGHDVLLPITKTNADWYKESLHISPIDAYSTMQVMKLDKYAKEVEQYIKDSVSFDKDIYVKTFEVNIRVLGGLLCMYQYTNDPRILAQTKDFGDRMLKAFNSPTGIPYYWVNLKTGAVKGSQVNTAEAASYMFEMGILSYYTKNPAYYQAAKKANLCIWNKRSKINLVGNVINNETGEWIDRNSYIGAGDDSYFEYLLKTWVLFKDPQLKNMWDISIAAINKYIPEQTNTGVWYGYVNMDTGEKTKSTVTLYDAFWPALYSLGGDIKRAEAFDDTWDGLWNKYGLEPSGYDYKKEEPTYPVYDLNPEIIESAYYLHYYTKNPKYEARGQQYYRDILKYCKTDIAFSSIADVRTMKQNNELPTFFFAETMKYFYLLFGGNPDINLKEYVFNTEAHPFKKSGFVPKEVNKRLGINN